MKSYSVQTQAYLGLHFYIGIGLLSFSWIANLLIEGARTHYLFFFIWLGYILTVDGLIVMRKGDSPLTRMGLTYLFLFLLSIPFWWLFEGINLRIQNWEYMGSHKFGPVSYFLFASLSFSTVIPAVLTTAEWVRQWRWIDGLKKRKPIFIGYKKLVAFIGLLCLVLLFSFPKVFYPLCWIFLFFLTEPLNAVLRKRSILFGDLQRGDWRGVVSLGIGVLICGLCWETWNWKSDPKWVYHIPYLGFFPIFEMPILGYLGYLPFALELFSFTTLFWKGRLPIEL
ncbi:hypothetical protein [Methylacidiphilum caldifontis]|uniref:Uncharacterized protein n=1 Tax=Methylacidiphilum caldifontis TaxID=2795386 RepID=A0A4Y8PHN3_9BACT|nr:hypothetical protein [Methylacidiphilum caldifontis]TFE72955.1 hypothetical protein A7Q10_03590 [Methylacidiphilum caldifontis]